MVNPEIKTPLYPTYDAAESYIQSVRDLYVNDVAHYQGRRDEDQQLVSWVATDDARLVVDRAFAGAVAVVQATMGGKIDPSLAEKALENPDEEVFAGLTWRQYRKEFESLLSNFAVITQRLHKMDDHREIPSYTDLSPEDQLTVGSALFYDFQTHNALRFGVDTAGVQQTDFKAQYDEQWNRLPDKKVSYDPDKATSNRQIEANIRNRGYRTGVAVHPAGKISVAEYKDLRRSHHDVEKDDFDAAVSSYQNVRKHYEDGVDKKDED